MVKIIDTKNGKIIATDDEYYIIPAVESFLDDRGYIVENYSSVTNLIEKTMRGGNYFFFKTLSDVIKAVKGIEDHKDDCYIIFAECPHVAPSFSKWFICEDEEDISAANAILQTFFPDYIVVEEE